MKKRILYFLLSGFVIFCIQSVYIIVKSPALVKQIKEVKNEVGNSYEEKLESYLNSIIRPESIVKTEDVVKNISIEKLKSEKYNVVLDYDNKYLYNDDKKYLSNCGSDARYYFDELIKTNNNLNKDINKINLICKKNNSIIYSVEINNFFKLTTDTIDNNIILFDANGNNLNKSVDEVNQDYIISYKQSCQTYDYQTILTHAADYKGKDVKYTGKVIEVIDDPHLVLTAAYRVNVNKEAWGYYNDTIYVDYFDLGVSKPKILIGDIITFYGKLKDLHKYETASGSTQYDPCIISYYIDVEQ